MSTTGMVLLPRIRRKEKEVLVFISVCLFYAEISLWKRMLSRHTSAFGLCYLRSLKKSVHPCLTSIELAYLFSNALKLLRVQRCKLLQPIELDDRPEHPQFANYALTY